MKIRNLSEFTINQKCDSPINQLTNLYFTTGGIN
jgi:hypothetical protein